MFKRAKLRIFWVSPVREMKRKVCPGGSQERWRTAISSIENGGGGKTKEEGLDYQSSARSRGTNGRTDDHPTLIAVSLKTTGEKKDQEERGGPSCHIFIIAQKANG